MINDYYEKWQKSSTLMIISLAVIFISNIAIFISQLGFDVFEINVFVILGAANWIIAIVIAHNIYRLHPQYSGLVGWTTVIIFVIISLISPFAANQFLITHEAQFNTPIIIYGLWMLSFFTLMLCSAFLNLYLVHSHQMIKQLVDTQEEES